MVVDDSKTIRNLVAFVLKSEGFKVSTAEDGLDAIEKLYSIEPVDLIVSDVNMPRMDGIERSAHDADALRCHYTTAFPYNHGMNMVYYKQFWAV